MAGNDDMTHYMKHLYLAFTERVFANSVSTGSAAAYRAMWQCGIPTPILGDIRGCGWGIRPG